MSSPIGKSEENRYTEDLYEIAPIVAKRVNPLCRCLDFPEVPDGQNGFVRNIEKQKEDFFLLWRRITFRNGRPSIHKLPIGICVGYYWPESWKSPPSIKVQIAHEGKKVRKIRERVGGFPGVPQLGEWQSIDRGRADWTVLEAEQREIDLSATGNVADWFVERFEELGSTGILDRVQECDREE